MTQMQEKCWEENEKLETVAHKNCRLGVGKYLNLEKQDWKMNGEINPRQGQERDQRRSVLG